jgi:two-component system, OmpR family, sensor histidine kinase SaeS
VPAPAQAVALPAPVAAALPWHKGLTARLAVWVCALMSFVLIGTGWLLQSLGGHANHSTWTHGHWSQNPLVLRELLLSAELDLDGTVRFEAGSIARIEGILSPSGCEFAILSAEGRVLQGSRRVLKHYNDRWPGPVAARGNVPAESLFDGTWIYTSVPIDDPRLGKLHLLEIVTNREKHAAFHGLKIDQVADPRVRCHFFAPQEQLPELLSLMPYRPALRWWHTLLMLPLSLLSAALLGWLVARVVTSRIRRLSAEAMACQTDLAAVSVPFTEAGQDEIFVLARTMNRLRERNLELLTTMQSRDQQRREWIAQVSHDLRTPLAALQSSLERLQRMIASEPRTELASKLLLAKQDGDRLVSLAEDLLEIARLDADPRLNLAPVPAGELGRSAINSLRSMAAERQLSLEMHLESGLPTIEADGRRLLRALENLLSNAVQHARKRVDLAVLVQGDWLAFRVSDDGAGFPAQAGRVDLRDLENRLSRRDSTGLGLKVALGVAEAHGGRLEARNPEEGGASITLYLPLH